MHNTNELKNIFLHLTSYKIYKELYIHFNFLNQVNKQFK